FLTASIRPEYDAISFRSRLCATRMFPRSLALEMRFWSRYTVCSALCQSNATQSVIRFAPFTRVSLLILTPLRSDSRAHVSISQAYCFTGHLLLGQIVANMRHPVGTFLTFDQSSSFLILVIPFHQSVLRRMQASAFRRDPFKVSSDPVLRR